MAMYWAQFEPVGEKLFRFDTRVYLSDVVTCRDCDPVIGAIVAKNPGSSRPSDPSSRILQEVSLNGGQLLPAIHSVVSKAFARAGQHWPERGYVQVFNLFYLCDKQLSRAWRAASQIKRRACLKESLSIPWLWYAWGRMGSELPDLSERFKAVAATDRFYFDHKLKEIRTGHPTETAFPKHTQGLQREPVIAHIAGLIANDRSVNNVELTNVSNLTC